MINASPNLLMAAILTTNGDFNNLFCTDNHNKISKNSSVG